MGLHCFDVSLQRDNRLIDNSNSILPFVVFVKSRISFEIGNVFDNSDSVSLAGGSVKRQNCPNCSDLREELAYSSYADDPRRIFGDHPPVACGADGPICPSRADQTGAVYQIVQTTTGSATAPDAVVAP